MNKWALIKKFEGCRGFKILFNILLFRSEKDNYKLLELSKLNFQVQWSSEEETLLFSANNKYVIFTNGKKATFILDVENKTIYVKIPFVFSFNDHTCSFKILAGTTRKGICVYKFYENNFYEHGCDFVVNLVIEERILCLNKKKNILILLNSSFSTLWQFDISQFGTYKVRDYIKKVYEERQREINRVYYHSNKIIVTLSRAIIALNPDDGKLLWKVDFENYDPVNLIFDGNIAYSGRLIYFAIIDIEKGIKLFERDFDPSYRFEILGYKLSQIRYIGLTLHNNFLWFTHEDKGHQFLLKAQPENGDIVDGMLLETKYSTDAPLFDGNRMYILDQEGTLYVYEEE